MAVKNNALNKKIVLIDTLTFILGVVLLIAVKICCEFLGDSLPVRIIFSVIAISVSIISFIMSYKKCLKNVNGFNVLICILMFLLFYIVYMLPVFGFLGVKGSNNSICLMFECTFGVKYITYFAYVLKSKSRNDMYKISNKALNRKTDYYKIIVVFAVILYVFAIIGTLINTFYPCIDMSTIYQLYI